jgi:hypothetical protein
MTARSQHRLEERDGLGTERVVETEGWNPLHVHARIFLPFDGAEFDGMRTRRPGFISWEVHEYRTDASTGHQIHHGLTSGLLEPEQAEAIGMALIQAAGELRAARMQDERERMGTEAAYEAEQARNA